MAVLPRGTPGSQLDAGPPDQGSRVRLSVIRVTAPERALCVPGRLPRMSNAPLYDTIGATYSVTRRTEPRIAERVWAALGDAVTVLNVGAGTGSYEPLDRRVLAVEPSALMRAQRVPDAAPS